MAAYMIVDCLLENPELYEQYKLKAKPLVEQWGGEYQEVLKISKQSARRTTIVVEGI